MTDNNHPITPPPELVEQWECEYHHMTYGPDLSMFISEKAARWGADQELEACCEWLTTKAMAKPWETVPRPVLVTALVLELRDARRPKPPSLKEQALAVVENSAVCDHLSIEHADILRRALEALDD